MRKLFNTIKQPVVRSAVVAPGVVICVCGL
jgi:hypothetical protein